MQHICNLYLGTTQLSSIERWVTDPAVHREHELH